MSISYREADSDTYELLGEVIAEYFPDYAILDVEPRISILMAHSERVPCLKLHGSPCRATVKVVKAEERANGGPDVRILLDACLWLMSTERRQRALLAHELAHLTLKRQLSEQSEKLSCEKDDHGRPSFGTRPADWQAEGFKQVVEWFGDDSYEKIELSKIIEDLGQQVFGFVKVDAAEEPVETNGWDDMEDPSQHHEDAVALLESLADEGLIERKATARTRNRKGKA